MKQPRLAGEMPLSMTVTKVVGSGKPNSGFARQWQAQKDLTSELFQVDHTIVIIMARSCVATFHRARSQYLSQGSLALGNQSTRLSCLLGLALALQ